MVICPNCRIENDDDAKYCVNCGTSLIGTLPTEAPAAGTAGAGVPPSESRYAVRPPLADDGLPIGEDLDGAPGGERIIWRGRPGWPLSWISRLLTRYRLTTERLIIEHGFVRKRVEQIDLFRVNDVDYRQGIIERIFGMGDIGIRTSDATAANVFLKDIKDPNRVKDLVWQASRIERQRRRVLLREDV